MPHQNFSDTEHRLENLSKMHFFRLYADIRHAVWQNMDDKLLGSHLKGYMEQAEEFIAKEFGVPLYMLVGQIVDVGNRHMNDKDGKDEAESGGR